jgi:hypothetical protein
MRQYRDLPVSRRKQSGIGFMLLTLLIACFVILPIALLAFELMRFNLIVQELRNVTDAAALAGSAALATPPRELQAKEIHELAMQTAAVTFQQNSVSSTRFNPANVIVNRNTLESKPSKHPNEAVLSIALLDAAGKCQAPGSASVKKLRVRAYYTGQPAFACCLHLPDSYVASAVADGGLPKLDLFICFDVSGSMDDQTVVHLVRRYWDTKKKRVEYIDIACGTIYELFRPPPTGSAVNAFWPQNLSYGNYEGEDANGCPWIFSEGPHPWPNKMNGLRCGQKVKFVPQDMPFPGATNVVLERGKPPGNYDPMNLFNPKANNIIADAYPNGYTDLVVEVKDTEDYLYPNIAVCLEASRGNLEKKISFYQSKGGGNIGLNPLLRDIEPHPGYYENYWSQAQTACQPIQDARTAALKFIDSLNRTADVHFGLEAFSDNVGDNPGTCWNVTSHKIDPYYYLGGDDLYPVPLIDIDLDWNRFDNLTSLFKGTGVGGLDGISDDHVLALGATGRTNIADALRIAIRQLTDTNKSRTFARKAIVLFTDGVANEPNDVYEGNSEAMKQAQRAHQFGIPIFTIGLSQNPDVRPLEDKLLGDGNNGSGEGIAYVSGNHAAYISVSSGKDLQEAFQAVARSLVVLLQHK